MTPFPEDVTDFLGSTGSSNMTALATAHLPVVTAMVKAYTRGRGFDATTGEPADDLAFVIVSSTARLVASPMLARAESIDDFSVQRTVFNGWTLPELAVLHQYRKRAA